MANLPHFPYESPSGYLHQPVTAATTHLVVGHCVDQLEELAYTIVEAVRNYTLGLCNAATYDRMGATIHRVIKDMVYLWRAHDVLVHLAGAITMEFVQRY